MGILSPIAVNFRFFVPNRGFSPQEEKKRGRCRANFFIPFNDFYALALDDDDDDFQKTTCEEEEEEEGRGLSGGCSLSLFLFLSFFLSFCFLSVAIFS